MKNRICYVVYTNSKCSDVWEMFIGQQKKYSDIPIYFISDKKVPGQESNTFLYEDNKPYYESWVRALTEIDFDFFIYLQEDFILYNNVNEEKILDLINFLNNSEYSFIRLIKSGNLNSNKVHENLYEIESNNSDIFSMQPTIWKTDDYLKIMEGVKEEKWLETPHYRYFMIQNNLKGLYYYDNENKRGMNHYDSSIYPYIATALVKGKWNLSEYQKELFPLIQKYKIDINKRGIF